MRHLLLLATVGLQSYSLPCLSQEPTTLVTFRVTTSNDSGPGSLRECLAAAASSPGQDLVAFAPTLSGATIALQSELTITDPGGVVITAPGITISGDKSGNGTADAVDTRILRIAQGTVHVSGISFEKGFHATQGGGIDTAANTSLTVKECLFHKNATNGKGGAIHSLGSLTISSSTLVENRAATGGAIGFWGNQLNASHLTIAQNTATSSGGGGVFSQGTAVVTLAGCLFTGNTAPAGSDLSYTGTGLAASENWLSTGQDSMVLDGFGGNFVGSVASPLDPRLGPLQANGGLTKVMLPLPGSPLIDATLSNKSGNDQRGTGFPRNADADLDGLGLADIGAAEAAAPSPVVVTTAADELDVPAGNSISFREAVRDVPEHGLITFSPTVFTPTARWVQPVIARGSFAVTKSMTISSSQGVIFDSNQLNIRSLLVSPGKRLSVNRVNFTGVRMAGSGGGIYGNSSELSLTGCSFYGNTASLGGAGVYGKTSKTRMRNCTFHANTASYGGGFVAEGGAAVLRHCTFAENASSGTFGYHGGGGIDVFASGLLLLEHSILAKNTTASASGPDVWLEAGNISASHCLISNNKSSSIEPGLNGNTVGTATAPFAVSFLPPGDYGGVTRNLPPVPSAPIYRGATGSTAQVDQRGISRKTTPDLGAAEASGSTDIGPYANQDWDGDGTPNGVEVATGRDPMTPDNQSGNTLQCQQQPHSGGRQISFGYNGNASANARVVISRSWDLLDWQDIIYATGGNGSTQTRAGYTSVLSNGKITITEPRDLAASAFYRMEVTWGP